MPLEEEVAGQFTASLEHGMTKFEDKVEKGGQRVERRKRKWGGGHQGEYETGGNNGVEKLGQRRQRRQRDGGKSVHGKG